MPQTFCRHCGAVIAFVKITATGKTLPVSVPAHPEGNVVAIKSRSGMRGWVISKDNPAPVPLGLYKRYRAHFADCSRGELKKRSEAVPAPGNKDTESAQLGLF